MAPALVVLAIGVNPSRALILSQVVLSFGIPFALIPLLGFCRDRELMGGLVNRRATTAIATVVVVLIVGLNAFLLSQTLLLARTPAARLGVVLRVDRHVGVAQVRDPDLRAPALAAAEGHLEVVLLAAPARRAPPADVEGDAVHRHDRLAHRVHRARRAPGRPTARCAPSWGRGR